MSLGNHTILYKWNCLLDLQRTYVTMIACWLYHQTLGLSDLWQTFVLIIRLLHLRMMNYLLNFLSLILRQLYYSTIPSVISFNTKYRWSSRDVVVKNKGYTINTRKIRLSIIYDTIKKKKLENYIYLNRYETQIFIYKLDSLQFVTNNTLLIES